MSRCLPPHNVWPSAASSTLPLANPSTGLAREENDLVGEQFLGWFLAEQREEIASMSALLTIVERAGENLLLVEDYLARSGVPVAGPTAPSPPAAGGAL